MRLLFLALFFSFSGLAQQFEKNLFENNSGSLPYQILLPKDYDESKEYPLLFFLHGAGERGNDNELQLTHGSRLFLQKEIQEQFPAIVVFPQCPKDSYWATIVSRAVPLKFEYSENPTKNKTLDLVEGLFEELVSNYEVDENRIYVGGLSMGGMGTFELVYRNPNTFAAAFAICGGANPKISAKIRKPVWRIDHGEIDEVVPITHSERMVAGLQKAKAQVSFNRYPGVNHNSWDLVFADPTFLPWLFSQSK